MNLKALTFCALIHNIYATKIQYTHSTLLPKRKNICQNVNTFIKKGHF